MNQSDLSKSMEQINPFAVTNLSPGERGVFGEATRLRSNFLYRVIRLGNPEGFYLVYDGWWFRQKVFVNGELLWSKVSWRTIERKVEFQLPGNIDPEQRSGRIEIHFNRGLMIRRFRVWLGDNLCYDEIN